MLSLSRATRSSRGKGKPQLSSFVQGSPVAACYRPPVPATGPRLSCYLQVPPKWCYPSEAFFRLFALCCSDFRIIRKQRYSARPQKDSQRAIDSGKDSRFQHTESFTDFVARNGVCLVHHNLRKRAQAISLAWLYGYAKNVNRANLSSNGQNRHRWMLLEEA